MHVVAASRLPSGRLAVLRPSGLTGPAQVELGRVLARAGLRPEGGGWSAPRARDLLEAETALERAGWQLVPDAAAAAALLEERRAREPGWRPPGLDAVEAAGVALRSYQLEGARFLAGSSGVLADAPGLGKTLQVLAALQVGAACNVVGPKNAIPEWEAQVERFRPDLRVTRARGRGGMGPARAGELVVGTLESLPDEPGALRPGAALVCDEAHALKGDTARRRRFKAWAAAAAAAGGRVWLLTGTPVSNADPEELWRVLDACGRAEDSLGSLADLRRLFAHEVERLEVPDRRPGAKAAVARVFSQHGARGWSDLPAAARAQAVAAGTRRVERVKWTGAHAPDVPERLRRAVLRRSKEEAGELPPLLRADRRVSVAPGALAELASADLKKKLERDLGAAEAAAAAGDAAALEALAQAPVLVTARRLLAQAKVPSLIELIEELEAAGEPALVFSAHVEPVEALGLRPGWGAIHGGTSADARAALRDAMQAGELRGLALSIRAASEALTLTRPAYVVFLDLDWVPAKNEQAEARAHRIGQPRPVTAWRLVADHPVDRRIAALLREKARFQAALLAAMA